MKIAMPLPMLRVHAIVIASSLARSSMSTSGLQHSANSQRNQTATSFPPYGVHAPTTSTRASPTPAPGQQRWAFLLEAATNTSTHHQRPGERDQHNDQQQYQATVDWLQVLRELYYYARQEGMCMHDQGAALPGGVKKPRVMSTSTTRTPPDREQLCPASQQALDQLLAAMAALQTKETFWQVAWRSMRLYLGVHEDEAQAGEGGSFQPVAAASHAEQQALKQIMEPHRQAEMTRIQQQLARLEDLGTTATAAAAADGPVSTPTSSTDALTRDEQAAAGIVEQPAAPASYTPELQHTEQQLQLMPAADPTPPSQTAATYPPTSAAMSSQGPPMQGWFNPLLAFRRPNLGRPVGSGNKRPLQQMQAGGVGSAAAGFSIRSVRYTGVYRSRRFEEGWRAQFAFANKVLNLGTFDAADDAARVWNQAAKLLRGDDAWLNQVEPLLPAGHVAGELHLPSHKAAAAVMAAAAAAGVDSTRLQGIKVVERA